MPGKGQLCLNVCLDLWNGAMHRGNSGAAGDRLSPHSPILKFQVGSF